MNWAIHEKGYSQRRACSLIGMEPKTYRYVSTRPDLHWRDASLPSCVQNFLLNANTELS